MNDDGTLEDCKPHTKLHLLHQKATRKQWICLIINTALSTLLIIFDAGYITGLILCLDLLRCVSTVYLRHVPL